MPFLVRSLGQLLLFSVRSRLVSPRLATPTGSTRSDDHHLRSSTLLATVSIFRSPVREPVSKQATTGGSRVSPSRLCSHGRRVPPLRPIATFLLPSVSCCSSLGPFFPSPFPPALIHIHASVIVCRWRTLLLARVLGHREPPPSSYLPPLFFVDARPEKLQHFQARERNGASRFPD